MKKIIAILSFVLSVLQVYANGDPVVTYSALALTCTPEPRRIPEIQLVSEDLTIDAGCPMSHVRVKYVLKNNSDKRFERIDYGFPVDWFGDCDSARIYGATFFTMAEQEFGWRDDYVKNVSFHIDDSELAWKCSKDTILRDAVDINLFEYEDEGDSILEANNDFIDRMGYCEMQRLEAIHRKWYYTSFAFEPHQTRVLIVDYQIANRYTLRMNDAYSVFKEFADEYQVVPRYCTGICSLGYDFRPAAYWGNGKTNDMHVSVSVPKFPYGELDSPKVIGLDMIPVDSTRWHYCSDNFDFSTAKALYVNYVSSIEQHEDIDALQKRRVSSDYYRIETIGKNIGNLSDNDVKSVGQILPNVEGKYQMKILLDENITLFGMLIYAGDCSSRKKYAKTALWNNISIKYNADYEGKKVIAVECHKKLAHSMSLQDLTDSAEKIQLSPYGGETCRAVSPKEMLVEIDADPKSKGTPIYVSDVLLFGMDKKKWDEESGLVILDEE